MVTRGEKQGSWRLQRLTSRALAVGIAVALAGCGSGSDSDVQSVVSESNIDTNIVLRSDHPALELKGSFEFSKGYLSESERVLRSLGAEEAAATFRLALPQPGYYEVFAWWPQGAPAGSLAEIVVEHQTGETQILVDQVTSGGDWHSVGIFAFDPAHPASIRLVKRGSAPLLVDAVRFQYVGFELPELRLSTSALPLADQDREYSTRVEAWGGAAPYAYRILDGALPPGLAIDSATGAISGIPAQMGRHEITVEVTDSAGGRSSGSLMIEVLETPNEVPEELLQSGAVLDKRKKSSGASQSLSEIVSAMPEGEWAQVNLNFFSNVWTPAEQRPLVGTTRNPTPASIIKAWSSFAWDSKRNNLILYGGGHANYRGNDVYIWNGTTRMWQRGSLPSEMKRDPLGNWNAIDGHAKAPASAHTYDNSEYLPIIDRFITLGGAADPNGGHFLTQATETTSRPTGPYTFDPARAHGNKVGGSLGSHVQRVNPYPDVLGGNMWANRENWLNASTPPSNSFVDGCTAYAQQGGADILYVRTRFALFKYTVSGSQSNADTWELVGRYGAGGQAACGHDPIGKTFVRSRDNSVPFSFWDLNKAGPKNNEINIAPTDPTGEFAQLLASKAIDLRYCGLDFDAARADYKLWCGDGRIWSLKPPATLSSAGWTITKERTPVHAVPNGSVGTGILGKWKYIAGFDAFVGLQDAEQGNVWIYKPVGWKGLSPGQPEDPGDPSDPGPGGPGEPGPGPVNQPPTVSITQPANGTLLITGQPVTIAAAAADRDGAVSKVEFFYGATKIGEDLALPFQIVWSSPPVGAHSLIAIATDDEGASTASTPVDISFSAGGGAGTVVLQRGANGYMATGDTYLSNYHKSLAFGTSAFTQDAKAHYSMLTRFAIFQSEGGPVPDGAVIQSARFSLYKSTNYNMVYGAHRILKDWHEGTANWTQTGASGSWAAPGANGPGSDYVATPDATASTDFEPGWIEFDVTAAVQAMSSQVPTANYGWRVLAVSGYTSALKKFHTSEYNANPDLRPKLTVTFH